MFTLGSRSLGDVPAFSSPCAATYSCLERLTATAGGGASGQVRLALHARSKHVQSMFRDERVYSTAMLSIYCGQVVALVGFVKINTGKRKARCPLFFYLCLLCVLVTEVLPP